MERSLASLTLALVSLCGLGAAHAQGLAGVRVEGNQVLATIALPGGLGADLTLTFEEVVGLQPAALGLSAVVADPLALTGRLPSGVGLPAAYPVLLRIEPPATSALSFSGVYKVELHTHNLEFQANSPLRLFTAPAGGSFQDMTETMGMGSYRVAGSKGSFSDFMIVADVRPPAQVVEAKFARLGDLLDQHGDLVADELLAQLQGLAAEAEAAWRAGSSREAAAAIETFAATVRAQSGAGIPDVWRPTGDLTNLAGLLRSAAATLRFSLNLAG